MDDSDQSHHDRRGLPVYFEQGPRAISDPADPVPAGEWHPANNATHKLSGLVSRRFAISMRRSRQKPIPCRCVG